MIKNDLSYMWNKKLKHNPLIQSNTKKKKYRV